MKKILIFIAILTTATSFLQAQNKAYEDYIAKYAKTAQAQQKKYGIPASITLAQGLLESGAGRSELTKQSNNHFGIKCGSDWQGESVTHNDDARNECFRKYAKAEDSFEDHSKFLKRARYQSLFELEVTDYKGWAHGLKQCGYATDPGYAGKLIKIIEDYGLTKYDGGKLPTEEVFEKLEDDEVVMDTKPVAQSRKRTKKVSTFGNIDLYQEHKVYRHNGRKYIEARAGETFEGLAQIYNMYEKTLRRYNDALDGRQLHEGDKVYLYQKRAHASQAEAYYRVREGENIWQIAQDKGIQLKSIYKLNGIREGQDVHVNQSLRLR